MNSLFEFTTKTSIAYGLDRVLQIGKDVEAVSGEKRAVLVTDPGVIKVGLADIVLKALQNEGVETFVFHDVKSDPTAASIDAAAQLIREHQIKCVIGLGGGSAMDVAKMAALVAGDQYETMHYALMANPFAKKKVKTIMLPTTSGTGAEVTSTVVFSTHDQVKVWAWDQDMAPELAILEPRFTVKLPDFLTAATTLDALVHAIEACTGKRTNPFIQALSLQAISLVSQNLETALQQPENLEARGKLAIAATLAGMAIEQGGTGLAHCIGHALGTVGKIHHGRAVSIALHAVYDWNIEGAVELYAEVAKALGVKKAFSTKEELAYAGAEEFKRLVAVSGLNLAIGDRDELSVNISNFVDVMLSVENEPMRVNNARFASEEDLQQFAHAIISIGASKV